MSLDQYIEPAQPHAQPDVAEALDGSVVPYQPDWRITALQSEAQDPAAKEDAFASIVHEYEEPLSSYARSFVGSNMAEDIVQDAFLSAFKALETFENRDPSSLRSWLYRITRNRALNAIRKDQNSPVVEYPATDIEGQVEGPELPAIANATDRRYDPVLHQEFHEKMAWLSRLPARQREALMLGIFGFTQDEIATHDGTNREMVKANVNRGRDNMRRMLLLERSGLVFS